MRIQINGASRPFTSAKSWIRDNQAKSIYIGISAFFAIFGDLLPFLTPILETIAGSLPSGADDAVRASAFLSGGLNSFWAVLQACGNLAYDFAGLIGNLFLALASLVFAIESNFLGCLVSVLIGVILLIHGVLIFAVHLILVIPILVCGILLMVVSAIA